SPPVTRDSPAMSRADSMRKTDSTAWWVSRTLKRSD
ncbi:MAG: hypothetical protein QOI51_1787, partial [Nocardioidaceae bacterium]|nr:hypothetical protein [Nocardioidaceae bacterium]